MQSDHPPNIIKNIPKMISTRLSIISSDEARLNEAKHDYERALAESGHSQNIDFTPPKPAKKENSAKERGLV